MVTGRLSLFVVVLVGLSSAGVAHAAFAHAAVAPAPTIDRPSSALPSSALPSSALPSIALSSLDRQTTPTSFTLAVDVPDARSAKLIVDGEYLGKDGRAPLTFAVSVAPGSHRLGVRYVVDGDEQRVNATFTGTEHDAAPPTSVPASVSPSAPASAPRRPAPSTRGLSSERVVASVEEIRSALASSRPGDVIRVADGEYVFKPRLVASASGTAESPISLVGSRNAVLRTKNASGDYGLHITGDYWHIQGVSIAHATKGVVLDGSVGTVIDDVEVYDIGDEGVHFRACSSDGVLRNSYVHDTGRNSPQYGEGVYVGSANSNWSKYECTDRIERRSRGDNTERVVVEDNVFEDVTAEGADLKEGTDSGTLRRNVFRRTGLSGQNSADSAVDAKGNNWIVEGNTVSEADATWTDDGRVRASEFADGFQAHSVYDGYGTHNLFRRNRVVGPIPGFGVGLYPALGNVVRCDNVADAAARGLVGENRKPAACRR